MPRSKGHTAKTMTPSLGAMAKMLQIWVYQVCEELLRKRGGRDTEPLGQQVNEEPLRVVVQSTLRGSGKFFKQREAEWSRISF